jgi:hypothetical protein
MTVPHNAAAMIANRRRLITLSSPPLSFGAMLHEACDGADLSVQKMIAR